MSLITDVMRESMVFADRKVAGRHEAPATSKPRPFGNLHKYVLKWDHLYSRWIARVPYGNWQAFDTWEEAAAWLTLRWAERTEGKYKSSYVVQVCDGEQWMDFKVELTLGQYAVIEDLAERIDSQSSGCFAVITLAEFEKWYKERKLL